MRIRVTPLLVSAVLGFATGALGHFLLSPPESGDTATSSTPPIQNSTSHGTTPSSSSIDTVSTLTQLPPTDLYPRLALWLLYASATEIEQFWSHYSQLPDANPAVIELILINWARLDPEAAIVATEDTEFTKHAWSAWACHDPDSALDELLTHSQKNNDKRLLKAVFRKLGQFRPAWLRGNFDKIPEDQKIYALSGYRQTADVDNPRESIDFLLAHNHAIDKSTLAALARQSPLEALELVMELKASGEHYFYPNQPGDLINTLAAEDPALLEQVIPQLKSPESKMQAQLAQFHALLKSDPTAAEQKALETPSGWAKQDQLAALARHHLDSDPEKAQNLTLLLLQEKGNLFDRSFEINSPGSSLSLKSSAPPTKSLLEDLIATDARGLMNAAYNDDQVSSSNRETLANFWTSHDLTAFAEWVNNEAPPEAYQSSASRVTYSLAGRARFDEAAEWAKTITDHTHPLSHTYREWLNSDPESARSWRQKASLNEAQNKVLDQIEEKAP